MFNYDEWSIKDIAKIAEKGGVVGKYFAADIDKGSIVFSNFPQYLKGIESPETGWKTHITVKKQDVERALKIVLEVCDKHDLGGFKVVHPGSGHQLFGEDPGQSGKIFTLYHQDVDVRELLQEIETKFLQAGIQPGPRVKGDRAVPGSMYLSMRTDHCPGQKQPISARRVAQMVEGNPGVDSANPFKLKDPYRDLRVIGAKDQVRLPELPGPAKGRAR
ncbi:class III lanthionine synthetase LanKC N-terminal domain-containing protein [Cupriavidus necator]